MKVVHFFITILLLTTALFPRNIQASGRRRSPMLPIGAKVRLGSSGPIDFAFSPDATRLAAAHGYIGIWLYDANNGTELTLLTGHTKSIASVAFSPNGKTLVSGSSDLTIRLWDVDTYKHKTTLLGHTGIPTVFAFSPDGKTLASGAQDGSGIFWGEENLLSKDDESIDSAIRLWDIETGKFKRTLTGQTGWITALTFSADGAMIACRSTTGNISTWNIVTGQHRMLKSSPDNQWRTIGVNSLAFSQDNMFLISSDTKGVVKVWQVKSGKEIAKYESDESFPAAGFTSDEKILHVTQDSDTISVVDLRTGEQHAVLNGFSDQTNSFRFSPDMATIVSGGHGKIVRLWDANTGKLRSTLTGNKEDFWSLLFSPDSSTLLTMSNTSREILLWDVNTGEHKTTIGTLTNSGNLMEFSPDGSTITCGDGERIWLWDVKTGRYRSTLLGHTGGVKSVAFSPDGTMLASGSEDKTVRLWDVRTNEEIITLEGHTDAVNAVAFSPDGRTLASGSKDKTVRLWNVTATHPGNRVDAKHITTLDGHEKEVKKVVYSSDGKTIASATWKEIFLWDIHSREQIAILNEHQSWISDFQFSPDGKTLASCGREEDPIVYLWETRTGKQKKLLFGHLGYNISTLAFSPDGTLLASGNWYSDELILWDIASGKIRSRLSGDYHGVGSLAFSADGLLLACGGFNSDYIQVWDTQFLQKKAVLDQGGTTSLAFAPNSTMLASYSGSIVLWDPIETVDRDVVVKIIPSQVKATVNGEQQTFNIEIVGGKDVSGYQLMLDYDVSTLRFISCNNGDFLGKNAFFAKPIVDKNKVTLTSTALTYTGNGDGTLASVIFEVVAEKPIVPKIINSIISDDTGQRLRPFIENGQNIESADIPKE